MIAACSETSIDDQPAIVIDTYSYLAGQTATIETENSDNYDTVTVHLLNNDNAIVETYPTRSVEETYYINRIFYSASRILFPGSYYLVAHFENEEGEERFHEVEISLRPSILIESLCHTVGCETLSGNAVSGLPQSLSIKTIGLKTTRIEYSILNRNSTDVIVHDFDNAPTDFDTLDNIVFSEPLEGYTSYIAGIRIDAFGINGSSTTTSIPIRVVRPIEVRYDGQYQKAQTYQPVPVTGCIPGSIDTRVVYSESTSETRQNSTSVTLSNSFTNSNSNSTTESYNEEITASESISVNSTNSTSNSENFGESYNSSETNNTSNNIGFSSSDGESWSWSTDETSSNSNSSSTSNNVNGQVNGSVTVGMSGEGSLPFLAKASGKVETTVGVSAGIGRTTTEGNVESNSNSRGYSMSGSSNDGRTWGSVTSESSSQSIGGSYLLGRTSSESSSQGASQTSGRVWNLSEGVSKSDTVTVGDSESISNTIVNSSSSSTTFSFSGYIPFKSFGMFYRQTTRWIKRSEIITYNADGFARSSGYIDMYEWSWAPELAISDSCETIDTSNRQNCYIEPCF